jgi:hypothetical protein
MVRSFFWYRGISAGVPLSMLALTVAPSQAQIDRQVSTAAVNTENSLPPSTGAIDLFPAPEGAIPDENWDFFFTLGKRPKDRLSPAVPTAAEVRRDAVSSADDPTAADRALSESVAPDSEDPNAGLRIPPKFREGFPIEQVFVYLRNPTDDPEQNEALRQQITNTFGIRAGVSFSPLFADGALNQVLQLPFVERAEYRLYQSHRPGAVILALLVTLQPPETGETPTPEATGWLVSGNFGDFPILYRDDRSFAKIILNGGVGGFSDTNPWFGSAGELVSGPYQPTGTVTWGEFYLEPGLAGITRLGDAPIYAYGTASYTVSATLQADIFRTDDRLYGDIEKLYGGLLVAEAGSPLSFNLSAGRQIFQLNQGFLLSQFSGSANALNRGASFSSPRTTYEMTVLANLHLGNFRLQGFFLEPDELLAADSRTQYLGTSLSYNNQGFEAVLTYVTVPRSSRLYVLPDSRNFTRDGLQVINPRLRLSSLFGVQGLWIEGEYAYQFSTHQSMSAQGGYVWLGYTAEDAPWKPSLNYRFAGFSGDNPRTSTYERFDPLQASGLTDWLQGINLGKIYNNSNSFSHRVTFKVNPNNNLLISLDYYYRFANQLNNLGSNPALSTLKSRSIGHEFLLLTRYTISQNFLLQGVGAIAFPGSAIRQAVDHRADPWITLQLSLFMFF